MAEMIQKRLLQIFALSLYKTKNKFISHCLKSLNQGLGMEISGKHILFPHNDELPNDELSYTVFGVHGKQ